MDVGVKELRGNLRHWLEAVQEGAEITITERGRPIARIIPAAGKSAYERMVAEGLITPAKRPRLPSGAYPRVAADVSLSDIVIEQRRR